MSVHTKANYLKSYSSHNQARPKETLAYVPKHAEPAPENNRPHVKSCYLAKRIEKIRHSQPSYERLMKAYSSLRARYASPSFSNHNPSPNRKYSLKNIVASRQYTPENKNSPSSPFKLKQKNMDHSKNPNPLSSLTLNKTDKHPKKLTLDRDTAKKDGKNSPVVSEISRQISEITKSFKKVLTFRADKLFISELANAFNIQALTEL